MTKVLFASDLHGTHETYKKLFMAVEQESVNYLIIGGDIAPFAFENLEEGIKIQRDFLENLVQELEMLKNHTGVEIMIMMGNDDFAINMDVLEKGEKDGILTVIHNKVVDIDGKKLFGYSYINPTPFRLKDWDQPEYKPQVMKGFGSVDRKFDSSIEKDLEELSEGLNMKNTICVFHAPPFGTNLDITTQNQHVGSKAIRDFITKKQPYLTLHGHIHETVKKSGKINDKIGDTFCVTPGSQTYDEILYYLVFDLDKIEETELKKVE